MQVSLTNTKRDAPKIV